MALMMTASMVANADTVTPCPIEVATDLVGGTISVDITEAVEGETVTITVTPDYGYAACSSDVDIELTLDPGLFHAPGIKANPPQIVGDIFHPEGDDEATHDFPATYTFTMPQYPLGVYIRANFHELATHRLGLLSGRYYTLKQDQEDPTAVPVGTVVTITVTYPDDLVLLSVQTRPSVELTDNGNNTFSFLMPDFNVDVYATMGSELQGVSFDSSNHWATYYGNYDLNIPENVSVYTVSRVADNEVKLIGTLPFIPMKLGVLLYSEVEMDNITTTVTYYAGEDDEDPYTSILQGSAVDQEISEGYGLYNDMFVRSQVGILPAHRCYLPASAVPAGAPRMLKIRRPGEGGVATGIDTVNTNEVVSVKYISTTGIVSDKPFDGINVKVVTRADGTTETTKLLK